MGVSSAATLQSPVHGGGIGGKGLIGVSSAATLVLRVEGGAIWSSGLIGVANAEEIMVAARMAPKITVQIIVQVDFMRVLLYRAKYIATQG
jgi:hypothetical protein